MSRLKKWLQKRKTQKLRTQLRKEMLIRIKKVQSPEDARKVFQWYSQQMLEKFGEHWEIVEFLRKDRLDHVSELLQLLHEVIGNEL